MQGSTEQFSIPSATYAAVYVRRYAATASAIAAVPLLCAIIAGFYDIRWWLIAIMCLLIVYPMLLTLAWLALLARPSMTARLRPQRWMFGQDNSVEVQFLHFPSAGEDADGQAEVAETFNFLPGDIDTISSSGRNSILRFRKERKFDFLIIPSDLFPEEMLNNYTCQ